MAEPYRPSNGTEGEAFFSLWCYRCRRDSEDDPCGILARALIHNLGDPDYPKEWVIDDTGPRCLAFLDDRLPAGPERIEDDRQDELPL